MSNTQVNEYAKKIIRHRTNNLLGKTEVRAGELDDIVQDLITDLLERLPNFDPGKASIKTYVTRIIDRKVASILRDRQREMRNKHREEGSLNDTIALESGAVVERVSAISQDEADMRAGKHHHTAEESEQLRIDVTFVLSGLPEQLREIATLLLTETKVSAAKKLGIPRTTLNDAVKRIRSRFEDAGLSNYL